MTNEAINTTDLPSYLFHQGTNYRAYEYLGCHEHKIDGKYQYTFRVWAPNADSVRLVSDFTSWDIGEALSRVTDAGVWEFVKVQGIG